MFVTELPIYVATVASCALYAYLLQRTRLWWSQRLTWLVVIVGVSIVCFLALARFTLIPLPLLEGRDLAVWCWGTIMGLFALGGTPIVAWQVWLDRAMLIEALNYKKKATDDADAP